MRTLELIVQPAITPEFSVAADAYFLRTAPVASDGRLGVLRVYAFSGEIVSLGRYHSAPPVTGDAGAAQLSRRHSGGRVVPNGDGFITCALTLPHRSALVSAEPLALAPHQVINRCVRGLLEGCKAVGVPAFYPGRDLVTVDQRVLAMTSFEVVPSGALLFEVVISNSRAFGILPEMLAVADPTRALTATIAAPDVCTSLQRELGITPTAEDVAEVLRRGYEQTGLDVQTRDLTAEEMDLIGRAAQQQFGRDRWVAQRRVRPDLIRHAVQSTQLGILEAYLALESDGSIKEALLCGDFIADSSGIEQLQQALRRCPADRGAIDAIVTQAFADPHHFILGIGPTETLSHSIYTALQSS